MEYILSLHPKYLGRRLQETIKSQLYNEVEGKYFPGIGYVLMVLDQPSDAGIGLIDPNTGFAEFRIKYFALVYCPIVQEVTYAFVTKITTVFLFISSMPCYVDLVRLNSWSQRYPFVFHSSVL